MGRQQPLLDASRYDYVRLNLLDANLSKEGSGLSWNGRIRNIPEVRSGNSSLLEDEKSDADGIVMDLCDKFWLILGPPSLMT